MDHSHSRVRTSQRDWCNVLTKLSRHVCEHVLSQLARVVARDSSIAVAGVPDLYVALCEDESVWGFFKRMKGEYLR